MNDKCIWHSLIYNYEFINDKGIVYLDEGDEDDE